MINLIGQWVGNSYGTNPGNIYIEFNNCKEGISVDLRFAYANSPKITLFKGLCVQNKDNTFQIQLNEISENKFTNVISNIFLNSSTESCLEGKYELNTGGEGVISISKCLPITNLSPATSEPPQIVGKEYRIDIPLSIHRKDIRELVKIMRDLVSLAGVLTITE